MWWTITEVATLILWFCKGMFTNLMRQEYLAGSRRCCCYEHWWIGWGRGRWARIPTTQLVKLAVIWTNTPHYIHLDGGGVDTLGGGCRQKIRCPRLIFGYNNNGWSVPFLNFKMSQFNFFKFHFKFVLRARIGNGVFHIFTRSSARITVSCQLRTMQYIVTPPLMLIAEAATTALSHIAHSSYTSCYYVLQSRMPFFIGPNHQNI